MTTQTAEDQQEQRQLEAVLALLAVGASVDSTARSLALLLALPAFMIRPVGLLLRMTGHPWPQPRLAPRSAALQTALDNRRYRSMFLVNASGRVRDRLARGVPLREAIQPERRYWQQHRQASANRRAAADATDQAAALYGPVLGWYARMDAVTSAECAAANGCNYDPTVRPLIGYPGSVHPRCRCYPGPPWLTRKTVDRSTARLARTG